ncbi:MAG: hypothetical protein RLZ12_350 [Bacillota bacterium]
MKADCYVTELANLTYQLADNILASKAVKSYLALKEQLALEQTDEVTKNYRAAENDVQEIMEQLSAALFQIAKRSNL